MALACGPGHRPAPMGVYRHLWPHFEPYWLFSLVAAARLCASAQPDHAVGLRLCELAAIQASRATPSCAQYRDLERLGSTLTTTSSVTRASPAIQCGMCCRPFESESDAS